MTCSEISEESPGRPWSLLGLAIALAAIVICPGCSDSSPIPDGGTDADASVPDGGITIDTFCPTFARTLCEGYSSCCEIEVDACIDRYEAECEAGEISSIRAGHATLDTAVARQCLDMYEQAFENCLYDDDFSSACRYQWYGFNGPGESCRDVWYCERGLGCNLDGVDGVCVELPDEGESCEETANCSPGGLYCSYEDWMCHREPQIGEPCERERICSAGVCLDGTCQAVPWCEG